MNKFMKSGAMMLLLATFTVGVVSCDDDDPQYVPPTPPVVTVAPNSFSGTVKTVSGNPVANALVKMTGAAQASVRTDAKGQYLVRDVKPGTYQVEVTADGMLPQRTELIVAAGSKGMVFVWDAMLYAEVKAEVIVSTTDTVQAEVTTEALPENTKAEVKVEAEVPEAAIVLPESVKPEEAKILISPLYNAADASARLARATTENVLMVGANVSCTKAGVTLSKTVALSFELDAEFAGAVQAMKYKAGTWQKVVSKVVDGKVVVEADEFTDYGLFLNLSFAEKALDADTVQLAQNVWNNLYGKAPIVVNKVPYSYKSGSVLPTKGETVLEALMLEKLAARYGAKVTTLQGEYPVGITLPIGTKLTMNAKQQKAENTVSAMNRMVKATTYGKVSFVLETSSREHTGSSN